MYKRTLEGETNYRRTASHATKPYGTGRVDVLPPGAKPELETYGAAIEQFEALRRTLTAIQVKLGENRDALAKSCFDPHEHSALLERRRELLEQHRSTKSAISRGGRQLAWAVLFSENAEAILSAELFRKIADATDRAFAALSIKADMVGRGSRRTKGLSYLSARYLKG